jgi:outer membrane protein assembly factor BamB/Icc-related predicted phosphoesterase
VVKNKDNLPVTKSVVENSFVFLNHRGHGVHHRVTQRKKHMSSKWKILFLFFISFPVAQAQPFAFAHVTDTHVGGSTGAEDLRNTVADINAQPAIEFVIISGDITEFGSGAELTEAHSILKTLHVPFYVVPGNHDSKWSESGCTDFVRIFGSETFAFEKHGIWFIGTASGPNMRMAPALVPREQILFLDSVISCIRESGKPVVFVNHYPLDESLSNSRKVLGILDKADTRISLCGHGHSNRIYDYGGLPGVMGRSNLRAGKPSGGYNICSVHNDTLRFSERITGIETLPAWHQIPLQGDLHRLLALKAEPADSGSFPYSHKVKLIWKQQERSDIGSGIAARGNRCISTTTDGRIVARNTGTGNELWKFNTGGKIFSTPAIHGARVVCPSTDSMIRCLDIRNGKLLWSYKTGKSIVASPAIRNNQIYTGSSEGIFRSLNLKSGEMVWQYDSVSNFVETRPLIYRKGVYFGSWGNTFYALDCKTGHLLWKREKYRNRMFSPAAVWPVAACGKVFIVAPDRRMTALDAQTGNEIWDSDKYSCRESIGISRNKNFVYIKNMTEGNVMAFETKADSQKAAWKCLAALGYEIAPSPITEDRKLIFVPTTSGVVVAINRKTKKVEWKVPVSEALVNHALPIGKRRLLVTTFDGIVCCLKY